MTNKDILKKAIEKAIGNGFDFYMKGKRIEVQKIDDDYIVWVIDPAGEQYKWRHDCKTIIFNHDFAKAFFGTDYKKALSFLDNSTKKGRKEIGDKVGCEQDYLWHLAEMVKTKDPIQYLKKFL